MNDEYNFCPTCGKRNTPTPKAEGMTSSKKIKIAIGFDPLTFEEIRNRADAQKISFAQSVRELVELGLECELDIND